MLRIALLASEVAPFAKTGGLADVAGALTRYLHGAGHDVRTFMPGYAQIDRERFAVEPVAELQDLPVQVGPHLFRFSVSAVRLPRSAASVHLMECPALYSRDSLYTFEADEHLRFLAFTHAAFACCQYMGWSPQILHCNDWHAGFMPLLQKHVYSWDRLFAGSRSVLTIHNIGYQGVFSAKDAADVGVGAQTHLLHQDDLRAGYLNPLKHGILYADAVTTVSPTHAREICTPRLGMGLDQTLLGRRDSVTGILNGVDYSEWDPRVDRFLPARYDADSLSRKAELKVEFLSRLRLPANPQTPLVGIVSRLVSQKGFDLLFDVLPDLLRSRDICLAVLGSGEERYEQFFGRLQRDFAHRVMYKRGYDEELSHWIEAASDMFLMPSLYEPCGLNQMYSLRYGTVPIVRRTGGLADSVQHYDPETRQGTGIVFADFDGASLQRAMLVALDLYAQRPHWERLVRNGMRQDFSWERQGALYVGEYERVLRVS